MNIYVGNCRTKRPRTTCVLLLKRMARWSSVSTSWDKMTGRVARVRFSYRDARPGRRPGGDQRPQSPGGPRPGHDRQQAEAPRPTAAAAAAAAAVAEVTAAAGAAAGNPLSEDSRGRPSAGALFFPLLSGRPDSRRFTWTLTPRWRMRSDCGGCRTTTRAGSSTGLEIPSTGRRPKRSRAGVGVRRLGTQGKPGPFPAPSPHPRRIRPGRGRGEDPVQPHVGARRGGGPVFPDQGQPGRGHERKRRRAFRWDPEGRPQGSPDSRCPGRREPGPRGRESTTMKNVDF